MIYLDNSATTMPERAVADEIYNMLTVNFGNPSSFHKAGLDANAKLREARASVAKLLCCESEEVYFTSGGTEANNLAILGAVGALRRRGKRIVTTAIEHESVLQTIDELEKQGFEIVRLMPDKQGNITKTQLAEAVTADTILVSMMYVNNEVGSVLPVEFIRKVVQRAGAPALVHIDCVQAFGKIPVRPSKLGADLVSVTAHKIHCAKGVGALYVKKGVRILPQVFGGEQEKKLRPGTEAIPLIAGFGKACELCCELDKTAAHMAEINAYARQKLAQIDGVQINSPDDASDYIINFYVPVFMTSQTVVQHLSSKYGICISNGSACAKGKKSHVLTAMKLPDKIIERSVRVSFSRHTTMQDVDALLEAIRETVKNYKL